MTSGLTTRAWATKSPLAQMRDPLTLEDYHASRWIIEPLHLLDCCLVSNGAVAVVVSPADRAASMPQPPAYILGMGQGHPGDHHRTGSDWETETGAKIAAKTVFAMAGAGPEDIDVCELYDCYTYTTLVTLPAADSLLRPRSPSASLRIWSSASSSRRCSASLQRRSLAWRRRGR